MLKSILGLVILLGSYGAFSLPIMAQDCAPPKVSVTSNPYNIFSPEQEMILGDLTYQRLTRDMRLVKDPQLVAYINSIGERLIRHLPPTGLKFQFHIVDIPEANAFNTPGGYVFVSRKLIAFSLNEDELAGVIAHELGHATVRHGASDISVLLKKILNVTQLGDPKDVTEKYNLLLERQRTKDISRSGGHEDEQQLEADRIGLYAMVAAGYDPSAFASFFERLTETKGRTGNWFSDIFGKAKPGEKRLRTMIKISEQLPAQCRENRQVANHSDGFLKWQADVISYRETNRKEELPGLRWKKSLTPKLRSDVSHIAVSDDGAYFIAQDDFAVTVVQRNPLQVLFQIPTTDALAASFTPDNKFVVFGTENLRYEKWSIAEKKPVEIRELVLRRDCWEYKFSPDGKYLACVDRAMNLNVIETQTGKKVWEKKEFYRLTYFELWGWIISRAREERAEKRHLFNIEFSPDSRFLAVSRSHRFRFSVKIDGLIADESEDTLTALDLTTLKTLSVGGDLKGATRRPFLFLDSNRILAISSKSYKESGIFAFPSGKRLAKFTLGGDELKRTGNPNYVIVKPVLNARIGLFDLTKTALVGALNKEDATIWNDQIIYESVTGKVLVAEYLYDEESQRIQNKSVQTVDIPSGLMGAPEAAGLSDNFKWLAVSSKSRGAVWDLSTGEQKIFVRGFRGALLANNGGGIGEFPRLESTNHSLVLLNPIDNRAEPLREIPQRGASQYGQFLLLRTSLKAPKNVAAELGDGEEGESLSREVRFEVRNIIQDKTIWSRDFPKEAPRYFFDAFSGRIIFYWGLGSDVGKARLKEDAALARRAQELGSKDDDYLLEVVDAFAGKTVGTLLLETGKGSFDISNGFSERDWLVVHDSENRVLVYSLKDGQLRHRFFGSNAAINPAKDQIVVENYPGELTFYDLNTGDSLSRLVLSTDAAFVRFSLDGKGLFVLSAEQTAYAFDVESLGAQPARAAQ